VDVSDGLFTVQLDMGGAVFDGSDLWLQIGVTTNGGPGYALLSPRQKFTATPYAIKAIAAGDAASLWGYVPADFASDVHMHSGGDITSGTVLAARIDSTIARDSELTWGNLLGIPADIADGDQVGIVAETDPQVGTITSSYVPKWNGSALVTGSIYDNGNIGIGSTSPASKLQVAGSITMDVSTSDLVGLGFRKAGAQNWTIFTAPWLETDDLRIRNESGPVDIMVFDKTDNRVGIRTTSPQATLDVNGDLRVSGNITYGSTKTGYASIAAAAFHPSNNAFSYNNTGLWITPSSPASTWFYAGVSLPHGAVITSVQWDGYAIGEGSYAELKLSSQRIDGSEFADHAQCYWNGSSGSGELTDTTIAFATVDNSLYTYWLGLFMNESGGDCGGGGVIITYTYTTP